MAMFASDCPPKASASLALSAVPAVLACFTESPGARLLTWFLAMFLTCFFSFLFRMLLIAVGAAIAVPANAMIRAVPATIIAGEGRRPFVLLIANSPSVGPSLEPRNQSLIHRCGSRLGQPIAVTQRAARVAYA